MVISGAAYTEIVVCTPILSEFLARTVHGFIRARPGANHSTKRAQHGAEHRWPGTVSPKHVDSAGTTNTAANTAGR